MQTDETIVAIASASESGSFRGIVRLSGPNTVSVVSTIFRCQEDSTKLGEVVLPQRIAGRLEIRPPIGEVPCDLFLWPDARSYTRQPTAELHTFGALPLLNAVVESVCQQGVRVARPGEFTLRAFLAGRIDLAQAEAVLGVIDAVDQRQLNVALGQLAGGLSRPIGQLRDSLLNLCADLEAGLDFVDEDIEFISAQQVENKLREACDIIQDTLNQMQARGLSGQHPRVVLRGEPNVGKSSLWNALCEGARAIVTDTAGTTRDYLTGEITLDGRAITLIDTAGVEPDADELQTAVRMATDDLAANAELVLLCLDASRPLTQWEKSELDEPMSAHRLVVLTKCDLPLDASLRDLSVDAKTSEGDQASLRQLLNRCDAALESMGSEASVVASTSVRCRDSLLQASDSLARALALTQGKEGDELIASEIRAALEHLGQIVGVIYTDDILDRVFSRFCIGK